MTETAEQFWIQIVERETGKVERRFGPKSSRQADKLWDGLAINLNHDRFYIDIVPVTEPEAAGWEEIR